MELYQTTEDEERKKITESKRKIGRIKKGAT